MSGWSFDSWITKNGFNEWKKVLEDHGFKTKAALRGLDSESLDIMGIKEKQHLGARKALLAAARDLNGITPEQAEEMLEILRKLAIKFGVEDASGN